MAAAVWGGGRATDAEAEEEEQQLSAEATLLRFEPPLPLLRGPLRAGPGDDPSSGTYVLAFRDAASWLSAMNATRSKLLDQCQAGARIGCSISASNKCKPPWWKILFGASQVDFAERERCEEREMVSCVNAAREACIQFAKEKCLPPFRDARIALADAEGKPELVFSPFHTSNDVSDASSTGPEPDGLNLENLSALARCDPEATNYRGSVLLQDSFVGSNYTDK